jgi:hypothetical protein
MATPAPTFDTAVPKRRYKLGEFQAVVLGDVQSKDDIEYLWVFALVREGEGEPLMYITLERIRDAMDPLQMHIRLQEQSKVYPAGEDMRNIENFTEMAIDAVVRLFELEDEEPFRLM